MYHYAGNNPLKYTDPDGREEKKYSWIWYRGYKIVNDNGTGSDLSDDRVIHNDKGFIYEKSKEQFDNYDDAYKDANDTACEYSSSRAGPPAKYNFDENDSNNNSIEIDIHNDTRPVGDGTTNDSYEVNRWYIVEEKTE